MSGNPNLHQHAGISQLSINLKHGQIEFDHSPNNRRLDSFSVAAACHNWSQLSTNRICPIGVVGKNTRGSRELRFCETFALLLKFMGQRRLQLFRCSTWRDNCPGCYAAAIKRPILWLFPNIFSGSRKIFLQRFIQLVTFGLEIELNYYCVFCNDVTDMPNLLFSIFGYC